jgi:hypothetical protein
MSLEMICVSLETAENLVSEIFWQWIDEKGLFRLMEVTQ